jgi:MFS family permease
MLPPVTREALRTRFRALRHRNFRLFWTGQLVSLIGTWMQTVAQGWLMHRLTSSAFMLGLLGFLQFLPVLLFSLWAGVVADHMDKRRLLLITQTAFLIQAATLAAVVTTGTVRPWMVLALAFVFGIFNAFDLPLRQSFIVEMVGKEDLSNAIALNSAAFNTARVLGPAVAGVLVATVGEGGCFWINAVSFVAVIASLTRLDLPPRATTSSGEVSLSTLTEGIRYALGVRAIRNQLLLLGFAAGLGFQYMVLLPVYARDILHAGPRAFGLMVSTFGVGSLLAAVWLTRKLDRRDLHRNLLIGLGVAGVGMGVFAWSRTLPLTLAMGFLAGFGLILYVASTNTLLQLTTEDRYRGRVMSLYTLMFIGTAPFGALLSGWIAQRFGAPIATSLSAVILLVSALWVSYRLRRIATREADRATEPPVTERLG